MTSKVVKRSGKIVDYDPCRIINALIATMNSMFKEPDIKLIDDLVEDITEYVEDFCEDPVHVEEIQDMIEDLLMKDHARPDIAKAYILYRAKRDAVRDKEDNYKLLTKEFISDYKHRDFEMTDFGKFVYYRTYSRWIPGEGRRENWYETVRRAVEYNCSLAPTTKEEAEELYDNMFNLKQFTSGRTMWIGGTDAAKKSKQANFNCSFLILDKIKEFYDLFYLLMVGTGVGIRVLKEDVDKLPLFRDDITVINESYDPVPKYQREDNTCLNFDSGLATIKIGDSKEGWARALLNFMEIMTSFEYGTVDTIVLNYDMVRPRGEPLKTFGGTASGYETLEAMFKKLYKIIMNAPVVNDDGKKYHKLRPVDCIDLCNVIGTNVVCGGVN